MSRPFSTKDAKRLVSFHNDLLLRASGVIAGGQQNRQAVYDAAENCHRAAMKDVLEQIPVEELTRIDSSIRVKPLLDYNYKTVADISALTASELTTVNGIGDVLSHSIRAAVLKICDDIGDRRKIKLSADDRSPQATALVRAIAAYRNGKPLADACAAILMQYRDSLQNALRDVRPAASSLRWIFSLSSSRARASEAYRYLSEMAGGRYAADLNTLADRFSACQTITAEDAWKQFESDPIGFTNVLEEIDPHVLGGQEAGTGPDAALFEEVARQPLALQGLLCTPRRYQEWGVKYILHQGRVLLGDEMGLGKTVEALAAMVALKNAGASHFFVVCPASVLTNWCKEIRKMSTLLPVAIYGPDRDKAFLSWINTGGVAVTTYETTAKIAFPAGFRVPLMVVDEAHYIKNPETQRTQNVVRLSASADRLLFMTGTALENRPEEMIALIKILRPDLAPQISALAYMHTADIFREKVAPVYFRRRREEVLTELPDLTQVEEWCDLRPEEEKVYEADVLAKRVPSARRVSWTVGDLSQSSKARRMLELIDDAADEGRKVIVYSFFLDTLDSVRAILGDRGFGPINGSVAPGDRQRMIDEFTAAPAGSVLVAQIQSGGTGLNIQAASVVIICEPQLKPSTENQAISRAYRMGQPRSVLVYRLLCDDTIDERMLDLLKKKQGIFDAFADKSAAAEDLAAAGAIAGEAVGTAAGGAIAGEVAGTAAAGAIAGDATGTAAGAGSGVLTDEGDVALDAASMGELIEEEIVRIREKRERA